MRSSLDLLAQVRFRCCCGSRLSPLTEVKIFQGVIRPNVTVVALEDINTALDALKAHEVTGRMVVVPGLNSTATNGRR